MLTRDEKIAKLGKVITDRATVLLGKDKITPDSPEYWGINSALKFTAANYGEQMAEDILESGATFFAIDVDDLTRYTCGLSRNDEGYRADTSAVLRLVSCVVRASEVRDVPVYLNGITTAELPAIPALLRKGGVRRFCTEKALLIPLKTTLMTVRAGE